MTSDTRTILVVENGLLLSAGVRHLLAADPQLRVVSTVFHGEDELIAQIEAYQPEVVVMTAGLASAQWDKLRAYLEGCREFRLVVIDVEDDCIDVYDKHKVVVTRARDLLALVRENAAVHSD